MGLTAILNVHEDRLAPVKRIELAEAMKVKGVVITSSPARMPWASSAVANAVVPAEVAVPCFTPQKAAKSSSNPCTPPLGPTARTPRQAGLPASPLHRSMDWRWVSNHASLGNSYSKTHASHHITISPLAFPFTFLSPLSLSLLPHLHT